MKVLLARETRPIGQLLQDRGIISEEDLNNALALQKERPEKLGRILIDLGYVAERDVLSVLSEQLRVPLFSGEYPAVPIEATRLPLRFLRNFHTIPVHLDDNVLSIVMSDPLDMETRSAISLRTAFDVKVFLATESEITEQLDKLYGVEENSSEKLIETLGDTFGDDENIEHLRDLASEVPVIRMVNLIISRAVEMRASDIHVEPFEKDLRLRYRIDGILQNIDPP